MKAKMRSFLAAICFALFGVGGLIIGCMIFPIEVLCLPKKYQRSVMLQTVRAAWRFFVFLMNVLGLINTRTTAFKKYQKMKGMLIAANHPSLIDVVILIAAIPNTVCLVKSALTHNFFVKNIVSKVYLVNNDSAEELLKKSKALLAQGYNILIFPEGTRTPLCAPPKLHRSVAQIALKTNARILPVQIKMSERILSKNQKWYRVGPKTVNYQFRVRSFLSPKEYTQTSTHQKAVLMTEDLKNALFQA